MEVPLTELKEGETGVITAIKVGFGHGRGFGHGIRKRLADMGLTPGTKITIIRSAPFNGPIEVYVRGYKIAIGRNIAERIFVEVQR
ncbi:MAG: FeoA family protein [Candidatus Bathyarchaeia archaeon]|nr:ferrous iron transport protein A [Candidatus Bathyarchaeota archaeon]